MCVLEMEPPLPRARVPVVHHDAIVRDALELV